MFQFLLERAKNFNANVFHLGVGGGGSVLIFSPESESLMKLREDLQDIYREIHIKILPKGHKIYNFPFF